MTTPPAQREDVRAMLGQAVAEAEGRGARAITDIHLELFDPAPETEQLLRALIAELAGNTLAEGARVVVFYAPSRFICWNCCGLRFASPVAEAVCPNCGDLGLLIPPEVSFALDHVDVRA